MAGGRLASCAGSNTAPAVEPPDFCSACKALAGRYLAIDETMPWARMVPRIASPTAAPIERDNWVADVATAMSSRLTEFYFWVALGGVAGGALAAIVAPLIFHGYWEYPIAITTGVVLLAAGAAGTRRQRRLDLVLPAALAAGTLAIAWLLGPTGPVFGGQTLAGLSLFGFLRLSLLFTVPAVIAFSFVRRPVRFGLAMGGIFLVSLTPFLDNDPVLWASRDFFGVHRVVDDRAAGRHLGPNSRRPVGELSRARLHPRLLCGSRCFISVP